MVRLGTLLIALGVAACAPSTTEADPAPRSSMTSATRTHEGRRAKPSETQLRRELTKIQYDVTQRGGTEPPYDNAYWDHHAPGIYVDVVTGEPLFSSRHKFDSGTGWPSFYRAISPEVVSEQRDTTHGMERVEIRSRRGDSHLGHVFDDGPAPTGLRYCINSAALRFVPAAELEAQGYGELAPQFATR